MLAEYAGGQQRDLSRQATFHIDSPTIATVTAEGIVRPLADGAATLTVRAGGKSVTAPVRVKGAALETPVSFSREVVPVLTRAGCNMGAVSRAQHGKGGFRLSLFGFDPAFDHAQIVQSAEGRRIVLSEPERSILLQKPTLVMEHAGGERFKTGSREYKVLERLARGRRAGADPGRSARDLDHRLAGEATHGPRRDAAGAGAGRVERRPR